MQNYFSSTLHGLLRFALMNTPHVVVRWLSVQALVCCHYSPPSSLPQLGQRGQLWGVCVLCLWKKWRGEQGGGGAQDSGLWSSTVSH